MDTLTETVAKLRDRVNAMQIAVDKNALDDEGLLEFERLFDMYQRAQETLHRRHDPDGAGWL